MFSSRFLESAELNSTCACGRSRKIVTFINYVTTEKDTNQNRKLPTRRNVSATTLTSSSVINDTASQSAAADPEKELSATQSLSTLNNS